jgi:Mlc titration factor MtfA (ptsG expression regulator)
MSASFAAVLAVGIAVLAALLLPPWLRARRRRAALHAPALGEGVADAMARNVPVTAALPAPLRQRLEGLVTSFLDEKQFVGCNGLEITDEIRATVAAQACLLLLGRPASHYDELQSILVYPGVFWVEDEIHDDDGLVTRRRRELSGEAWDSHRIILSWDDVAGAGSAPGDGYNVVLHEFAHYLDAEGLGPADRAAAPEAWRESLAREFRAFCARVDGHEHTYLDPYAAEDEAEFFAVATEEFFECPLGLRAAHPGIYRLLQSFYGTDPAAWTEVAASADIARGPHGPG